MLGRRPAAQQRSLLCGSLALLVAGLLVMLLSLVMVTYVAAANPYPQPAHCKARRNVTDILETMAD